MSERLFPTRVVEIQKSEFQNPLVVCGFVEAGLVGVASVGYIIDHLQLHQIAYVKSEHIPPVAVFIGEKLRRAFRIYADDAGKLVGIVCEVPIDIPGLYEISSVLLDWFEQIRAREVVIIDGIPVKGMPTQRETYCVAEEDRCKELKNRGFKITQSAMIAGLGGSILSECLARNVTGLSLLTPTSVTIPDPGAVLSSIRTMNNLYNLGVDTTDLEKNVSRLNKYLNTLVEEHRKLEERRKIKPKDIYG